jgi:non-specific serine/threonine protein kinase
VHEWSELCSKVIEGRFFLRGVLGEGGFGCVFSGEEFLLGRPLRPVAVKLIRPHSHLSHDRQVDELMHAIRLEHPTILRGYAAGLCTLDGEEFLYLVMEQAETSLAARLSAGPLPPAELRAVVLAIARALAYCHTPPYHLVHCDVKPANLLYVQGQWKLADFGIARALGSQDFIRERAFGTLDYAPPESLTGVISPAWDIWSLGMLLLEAATGRHPFAGTNDLAECLQAPVPIPDHLPKPFSAICRGSLTSGHLARWTAHQVLVALDAEEAPVQPVSTVLAQQAPVGGAATGVLAPAVPPHHLPQPASRFVGRARELEEIIRLLQAHRLLTLTGIGGSGKTRLALEAARLLLPEYKDGAWFVDLAPITDAAHVPGAVLKALNITVDPARPALETLFEYLVAKHVLIILDNCEHLIDPCALLVDQLLREYPNATILCTSRETLRVEGEITYRVPTLALPVSGEAVAATREGLSAYEAVALFLERAATVNPRLQVTAANAAVIVEICRQLDGIPFAIELAAARLNALTPEALLTRLNQRFRLLTGGNRTALPRQQTLHALLDWSYNLLGSAEQCLLRRLSVFAGGWLLQDAEGVCAGDGVDELDILDLLSGLVEKSLVISRPTADGEPRYDLLQTVRQYAEEKLEETEEAARLRERHYAYFLQLADCIFKTSESVARKRLHTDELDNIRTALQNGAHDCTAVHLVCALTSFSEQQVWLHRLLQQDTNGITSDRALTFFHLGTVADSIPHRLESLYKALKLYQQLSEDIHITDCLVALVTTYLSQGDGVTAHDLLEQAKEVAQRCGCIEALLIVMRTEILVHLEQMETAIARPFAEEFLALSRSTAFQDHMGSYYLRSACISLAHILYIEGNYLRSRSLALEALQLHVEAGHGKYMNALRLLGDIARREGRYPEAREWYHEACEDSWSRDLVGFNAVLAMSVGCLVAEMGNMTQAVCSIASYHRILEKIGVIHESPIDAFEYQPVLALARAQLGDAAYQAAWEAGRAMSMNELEVLVRSILDQVPDSAQNPAGVPAVE